MVNKYPNTENMSVLFILYWPNYNQFSIGDTSFDCSSSVAFGWSEIYLYI